MVRVANCLEGKGGGGLFINILFNKYVILDVIATSMFINSLWY